MEVMEAIKKRRSIRRYQDREISREQLQTVLEAARLAPSSSNLQSWKFKVVTDPDLRSALREASFGQKFVERAPVVIVGCVDFAAMEERSRRTLELLRAGALRPNLSMVLRYLRGSGEDVEGEERALINGAINLAIAMEHMALAAVELGLGTCWVRAFLPEKVAELLDIPSHCVPLALLTLGHPREDPEMRPRKSLNEIIL